MESKKELWEKAVEFIKARISEDAYNTWFAPISPKEIFEGKAILEVPNLFFAEWLEEYYSPLIKEAFKFIGFNDLEINYKPKDDGISLLEKNTLPFPVKESSPTTRRTDQLNPRYTFENFVVGESNRFACAAARRVAEDLGSFNPLFIYGGVGLGKTHLLHAIGNFRRNKFPEEAIYLTSCENFFLDFIQSLQEGKTLLFKTKYRQVSLLLLDDIHYLIGKERLQEEIFHTFNHLQNLGKQIVFTSDRPPREIPTLEERLASRLGSGLVCDIGPPDLETRIAILKKKAEQENCSFSPEIYYLIAERIKTNIRDLESALIRLIAYRSIIGDNITIKTAQEVLAGLLPPKEECRGDDIIQEIINEFSISKKELFSNVRTKRVALARQVAMYLFRRILCLSLKEIGSIFGGKDHTTVIHACEKIEKMAKESPEIAEKIERIIARIKSR
jgi:chromosomal replication initiator protein|uniref:Chromosomal replication initiator protein DnaA n=1 Tax=candidate division WOR-3 bacterium TaxID=2052148 RepID=A0A7C3UQ40_UNCW3